MSNIPKPRRQKQFVVYLKVNGDDKEVWTSKGNYDIECKTWVKDTKEQHPFLDFTISPAQVLTHPRTAGKITLFAVVKEATIAPNEFVLVKLYESIQDAEKAIYDIWYAANNANDFGYCKAMYNSGCLECYSKQHQWLGYAQIENVVEYHSDTYIVKTIEL